MTPDQFIPKAKSYLLPSVSVWQTMSRGTSSNCSSTVCMPAGSCMGRRPEGSLAPLTVSRTAWFCTPNESRMASHQGSISLITIGLEMLMTVMTGLAPMAFRVSRTSCMCDLLEVETVLPLYERLVKSSYGSPPAMLVSRA